MQNASRVTGALTPINCDEETTPQPDHYGHHLTCREAHSMRTNTLAQRTLPLIASGIAVLAFSGCASIVKGTVQSITVNTDPTAADCMLSRDGQQINVVNPTPGTIQVGKAAGTISIACKKVGYQDSVGTLSSSFQAMTFGNIIFGGIIGVAVDAATGAMNEYPPMITITLVPEVFPSVLERDAFFDKMRLTLLQEADEVKDRVKNVCKNDCDAQLKAVDEGLAAKQGEIENRRSSAKVRGQ